MLIQVFQGEREIAQHNKPLGTFELTGIAPAPRGVPQIEVTFDIDANGIVHVSAKDRGTGKEQSMTISGGSALPKEEIDRMVKDAEAHAEEDKTRREETEARNTAEQLVYSTEKFLVDSADKIPADGRGDVDAALADLKDGPQGRLRRHPRGHRDQVGQAVRGVPEAGHGDVRRRVRRGRGCRFPAGRRVRRTAWRDRLRRRMTTSSTPRSSRTTRPRTRSDPARRQHGRGAGGAAPDGPPEPVIRDKRRLDPETGEVRPSQDAPRGEAEVADDSAAPAARRARRHAGRAGSARPPEVEGAEAPAEGGTSTRTPALAAERLARPAAAAGRVRQLQAAGRP